MKNAKWMLAVTVLLLSGLVAAQSITSTNVVANVPFDFMVNNKVIPAGDMTVRALNMDGKILAVNNFEARTSAFAPVSRSEEAQASTSTVLVFKQYGGQYFLTEIRIEGSDRTYKLPVSRVEHELRAQNVSVSQTTLLAALK